MVGYYEKSIRQSTMKKQTRLEHRQMKRNQFVEDYIKHFLATGVALNAKQSKEVIKKFYS